MHRHRVWLTVFGFHFIVLSHVSCKQTEDATSGVQNKKESVESVGAPQARSFIAPSNRDRKRMARIEKLVQSAAFRKHGTHFDMPQIVRDAINGSGLFSGMTIDFDSGTRTRAIAYYRDLVEPQTGLRGLHAETATLNGLISYLGYAGLSDKDLEQLPSSILMDPGALKNSVSDPTKFNETMAANPLTDGELLSVRYFAPKIINVSDPETAPPDFKAGWRKLVRLQSRPDSLANTNNIDSASILFNFASDANDQTPFEGNSSSNNQVMLSRNIISDRQDATAFFLVYDDVDDGGKILDALRGVQFEMSETTPEDGKYYVPATCMDCHGQDRTNPRLNFLDTDHWFDRLQPDDDFSRIDESMVLYDVRVATSAAAEEQARNAIHAYNREVASHNTIIDRRTNNKKGQSRGVQKWIELHPTDDDLQRQPPERRGYEPLSEGELVWDPQDPQDVELVGLLNRFCYRCHSSIVYSVFDKQAVYDYSGFMHDAISGEYMPQDRNLETTNRSSKERAALEKLRVLLDSVSRQ